MITVFLTKTMQLAKEKANTFPTLFDTYFFKALNPRINIDQRLVYIRKLRQNTLILLGYLNDIEGEKLERCEYCRWKSYPSRPSDELV